MSLQLIKDELKVFIKIIFRLFRLKYLFKFHMEGNFLCLSLTDWNKLFIPDTNYVLSPMLSFFVVDYFCHFTFIRLWNLLYVYINALICCLEVALLLRTDMVFGKHGFILGFQLLVGVLPPGSKVTKWSFLGDYCINNRRFTKAPFAGSQ